MSRGEAIGERHGQTVKPGGKPAPKPTIAKRPLGESGLSDSTCTPKWLADLLPHRDVDPCSNERSHVKAEVIYTLTNGKNGLELPWLGSAFANWPFAAPLPFAQKAQRELREGNCTDLIVLCKMDPSTRWWAEIKRPVPGFSLDLWIPEDRIQYDEHPELIEKRRLERLAEALNEDPLKIDKRRQRRIAKARKAGATDIEIAAIDGVLEVDGESTANFVSVLFHHRKRDTQPWWPFATFAERWTLAADKPRPQQPSLFDTMGGNG